MRLKDLAVVILAAGRGVRFGESYSKLLHPVFGKPLIYYPIQNLKNLGVENIIAVVSDSKVEGEIEKYIDCKFVHQKNLTGTAEAVKLALPGISKETRVIMVLNGDDATLYSKKTLEEFLSSHKENKAEISLMTIKTGRQMDVGRIIRDKRKHFAKILEFGEYLKSGVSSNEINCGVYLINFDFAKENLPKIPKNSSGEYYLTDLLNIAQEDGRKINLFVLKDHSQWIGVNSKKDLKYAENIILSRNSNMSGKKKNQKHIHFLGIAGSGTSACANLAKSAGFIVSGCDKDLSGEFYKTLLNIKTFDGHSPAHLKQADILAVSPAVLSLDPDNPELLEARERKIPILTWQQFLGKYLTKDKFVIAVTGTHGKSTTTAMTGKILEDSGLDPTVLLGANTHFWDSNFKIGNSKYFVVEADEFNDNYLSLTPDISIVTNIEFDHPEYFKDFNAYQKSFQNFLRGTKSLIIANLSDQNTKNFLEKNSFLVPVVDFSKDLIDFPLKVSGIHNIYAASAAFALGLELKINPDDIKSSLQSFPGIGRRMELIGKINGAKVFSDFAHHPTAVKVATEQLKKTFPDKDIRIVYQPHMFSRTRALFDEFVENFKNIPAKEINIIDIYPSRETDAGLIHSRDLVNSIDKPNVKYADNLEDLTAKMHKTLSGKDILVFMGAGDIDNKIRSKLSS